MKVRIKKLCAEAVIPTKAHTTDASFDLTAVSKEIDENGNIVYGTGLAFEIPKGYVGLLFPRSSICKKDLQLSNSVGVIDSGYRGEVMLKFRTVIKDKDDYYRNEFFIGFKKYKIGDRIGQLIIIPIPEIELEETTELSDSDRGTGGYGSTGK